MGLKQAAAQEALTSSWKKCWHDLHMVTGRSGMTVLHHEAGRVQQQQQQRRGKVRFAPPHR